MKQEFSQLFPELYKHHTLLCTQFRLVLPEAQGTNEVLIRALEYFWQENTARFYPILWLEMAPLFTDQSELVSEMGLQLDLLSQLKLLHETVLTAQSPGPTQPVFTNQPTHLNEALLLLLYDGLLTLFNQRIMDDLAQAGQTEQAALLASRIMVNQDWLGLRHPGHEQNSGSSKSSGEAYHQAMFDLLRQTGGLLGQSDSAGMVWFESALDRLWSLIETYLTTRTQPELEPPPPEKTINQKADECWRRMNTYLTWLINHGLFV